MAHLVRLDHGVSQLVAHGRLDGWLPRFYLGYQEFLFNGPGMTWAVAAARGVTFGVLSNSGGLMVIGVASFAAVPLATAFLARSIGLDRLAAGIAAVLSLLVSSLFGVGLQGLYLTGLVPHQLGAVFFCLALGALLRVPIDARRRWMLLAAVSLVALAITHLISVLVLAVFLPLLVIIRPRELLGRDCLARLALTGLLTAALAAWWLAPALAHRDLRGIVATWETPPFGDRVDAIVDGQLLFRPYTIWLVVAGWVYGVTRVRRQPFAFALVAAPVVYLVIAHWAASRWPDNEITLQLANRGLGNAGVLAVLPLAAALAAGARLAARRLRRWPAAEPAAAAVVLAIAVMIVVSPLGPDRRAARQIAEPRPQLRHAARELTGLVPPGARFVTQREYPDEIVRAGIVQPATWLTHESGRNSLNGFNLESSSTPEPALEPEHLGLRTPEADADALGRLGVSHIVTTGDALAGRLEVSERFALVWRDPPIAIFALRPRAGYPDPHTLVTTNEPATARVERADAERLRLHVNAARATPATLAIAWSPKWDGSIDGRGVHLDRTRDGLIGVQLAPGAHTLELRYGPDIWDRIGVAISAATVVLLIALGASVWNRRRLHSTSKSFSRIA
jgi:hypothetical protein